MNMKDSKTLLLEYLASVRDPERAASLFAEDEAFELPFLRSLGVEPQLFTGYLVAEAGEIKLLRESFNPLAMAQAQLPNGAADIPPPGDEVHSF
jgi:hypothetical protein